MSLLMQQRTHTDFETVPPLPLPLQLQNGRANLVRMTFDKQVGTCCGGPLRSSSLVKKDDGLSAEVYCMAFKPKVGCRLQGLLT